MKTETLNFNNTNDMLMININDYVFLVGYHIPCAGRPHMSYTVDDCGNVTVDENEPDY